MYILFGLLNMFRGGSLPFTLGTQAQRVIFALSGTALTLLTQSVGYGHLVLVALALYLPWLAGTGRPMSAIANNEKKALLEFPPFDLIALKIADLFPERLTQPVWGIAFFASLWLVAAVVALPALGMSAFMWSLYGAGVWLGYQVSNNNWKAGEFGGGVILGMGVLL